MRPNIPTLILGRDYEELRGGKYRFRLLRDVYYRVAVKEPTTWPQKLAMKCDSQFLQEGKVWMEYVGGWWRFMAGYAWNGCSPKWWMPFFGWVGTPDTAENVHGSLPHDGWFQFLQTAHFPYQMDQVNELFGTILQIVGARGARVYGGVVNALGPVVYQRSKDVHSRLLSPGSVPR